MGVVEDIAATLDEPLFEAFANGPTQALSKIRSEDITTPNTPGATGQQTSYGEAGVAVTTDVTPASITFEDFVGAGGFGVSVPGFRDLFEVTYESYRSQNPTDLDLNGYIEDLIKAGEFDHHGYHPGADFVSSVLDFTIVWPLFKSVTGHDPITGEDLSDLERVVGAGAAVADLVALILAVPSGGGSLEGAAALRAGLGSAARVLLINALATGTSVLTFDMAQALDLPPWAATLLAVGVGLTISVVGGKFFIRNLNGEQIGEGIDIGVATPTRPRLTPPVAGDRDGGAGSWTVVTRKGAGSSFQATRTGVPNSGGSTLEYRMPYTPDAALNQRYHFVDFDGHDAIDGIQVFIDAKDGYRIILSDVQARNATFDRFLKQAKRQIACLEENGLTPDVDVKLEWQFSDKEVADMVRQLFVNKGLPINVVWAP